MRRYYSGEEKVADLLREYNLGINPSKLTSLFPPVVHADKLCPYCNVNLVSKRVSKSAASYHSEQARCPKCNHVEGRYCNCANCKKRLQNEQERITFIKRDIFRSQYSQQDFEKVDIVELSLLNAVALLALWRHSLNENLSKVRPYDDDLIGLAPTFEFTQLITVGLYQSQLITIGLDTNPDAINLNEEQTMIVSFKAPEVDWEFLPGHSIAEKKQVLNDLEALVRSPFAEWPQHWRDEIPEVWEKISRYDCIENLIFLLKARNFETDIGEKTHEMFTNILKSFSVGQIFNLSWSAIRDATDFMVQKRIPRSKANGVFLATIQRYADRALANQWVTKPSRRDNNLPQSVMSAVFLNTFLKVGDIGFNTPMKNIVIEGLV